MTGLSCPQSRTLVDEDDLDGNLVLRRTVIMAQARTIASIDTPRAVAVWLSTGPTPAASDHAFDALVAEVGHEQAMRTWITGMRIARGHTGM